MNKSKYVIGIDYGTDSVRSVLVDTVNGNEIADSVFNYPRWNEGKYCSSAENRFRQHPLDYIEGLEYTIKELLAKADPSAAGNIVAMSVDTTGSTPVAVNEHGVPLSLTPGFENNPNAMFILWKDHTSVKEAEEINTTAKNWGGADYTMYEGGVYSSEWFWAKILHVLREDKEVREAAYSWLEHCDWIPALLTGAGSVSEIKRSRCAAGHKAMWHEKWGGLPPEDFLTSVDPLLAGLRQNLYTETHTIDKQAGIISREWAEKLGLPKDTVIGVGAFDAHLGAVGGEIKPYYLCKIIGTSTCDILTAPKEDVGDNLIKGICGQVDGSVLPGMIGLEAGQSAFGDVYAWFKELLMWPLNNMLKQTEGIDDNFREEIINDISGRLIPVLSDEAGKISPDESGVLALDWLNGRRTPDANQNLKGAVTGLSLGSDAPRVFRALVESTAYGAKAIIDSFIQQGVKIEGVIALGGVAKKSDFVMQVLADVLNKPILVAKSEQACALGSAMAAAVSAGVYSDFSQAKEKMGSGIESEYQPDPKNAEMYRKIYNKYLKLGKFAEDELT